ncbi:DUF5686 family protein [Flavobacterium aciduliphilum]|uniref:Carboxypeptidase-like protein n=1 Tax=Flavobacterium aciduliphilum TaxID=1101402 RepID=A0A328YEV7_9FLAO|nr:DUF5686 family protein [Flavobacterium aciduliphilum]RAR71683.1 hypothetical protein CLV55_10631 [Flavobacterium aciduliphilum]
MTRLRNLHSIKKVAFFLLFFIVQFAFSQKTIQAQVLDFDTSVPIAFAKITYNNTTQFSNWEGKFSITLTDDAKPIVISYKGYYDKTYYQTLGAKNIVIKMVSNTTQKNQEILTENAVNQLIKKAIQEKDKNNPEKALRDFDYKNYEHLLISANPDSISSKIDTVIKKNFWGKRKVKLDSSNYKFRKLVEKQHLYQTEKVNRIQHNAKGTKETILATRMAGFKKPLYEILGLNLVTYSLYEKHIDILEIPIRNPISTYGRNIFVFKIVDTVTIDHRKTYQVYFQPKKNKESTLRGLLYIDAENYGIAKAFFRIYGIVSINASYTYTYLTEHHIWFPKKRLFEVVKGNNKEDLTILGETIKFNSSLEKIDKNASDQIYLKLESTPFDIHINTATVQIQNPSIKIDVPESSISKPDSYWKTIRKDSIDVRKINTYTSLDSLSAAENIENKIVFGKKIINGYLPYHKVDFDMKTLLKYNNFEGFRLGIGGVTNSKFSETYKISGYAAYGFKDEKVKFGITPSYLINKETNTWVSGSYSDDLSEIGQIQFATQSRRFKLYDSRPINISTFYSNKSFSSFIETKAAPKTDIYFGCSRSSVQPLFEYLFHYNEKDYSNYIFTTIQVAMQWNPFSDYMQTASGRLEIEKRFPKFSLQITKSLANVLGGNFDFTKVDFRIVHEIPYLSGQNSSFLLQGGLASGAIPLTHLYSIAPNNLNKESVLKRITFSGRNSFETMYFNEFFSSKYITFHAKHTFNKIKLANKIKPELTVVTRMAWGTMDKPEQYLGFQYKTLDKGFFESGLEANQIYKGFGLTFFVRYGPNALPQWDENLSIKLSYVLDLGF